MKSGSCFFRLCVAIVASIIGIGSAHALLIDVKALYRDRYSIESVEVTNLANGKSVTLSPGQTLALGESETRAADVKLPFADGDDLRFTSRATDGEVTVITERPSDDHTLWVHFINTLDSAGKRHTVHKIGGRYYITDVDDVDALANKSWQRPDAEDLNATTEYFKATKLHGLKYKKELAQSAAMSRGMQAFTAKEAKESTPLDMNRVAVSRDEEANHRALIATMLGFDPDEAEPSSPKPFGEGKSAINIGEKMIAFPGLNFSADTDLSTGVSVAEDTDAELQYTFATDDDWDMVITKPYDVGGGIKYNMTLYGKRGNDLQLVIYQPNPDGSFTETKRYSIPDHLNYAKYEDDNWKCLTLIRDDIPWKSQLKEQLHSRKYMRMQAAEAETELCQSGQYIFVMQGGNITKINTVTGEISTKSLTLITPPDDDRVCWTSVTFDLNNDNYEDVLAFVASTFSDKYCSVTIYGSADGFADDYVEQGIDRLYSSLDIDGNLDNILSPASVSASIVYPEGCDNTPYLYFTKAPVCTYVHWEADGAVHRGIEVLLQISRIAISDETIHVWDGTMDTNEVRHYYFWGNHSDNSYANGGNPLNEQYEFYWKTKMEPVYDGGLNAGLPPIIATNWNRVFSADLEINKSLYPATEEVPNVIDIHFDQFDPVNEDKEIPKPSCCVLQYENESKAHLYRHTFDCNFDEIPSSTESKCSASISLNGDKECATGFASVPLRYKEGVVLEYAGCEITASNPTIFGVLAAPPFNEHTAVDGGSSASSFCTVSTTTGEDNKDSVSHSFKWGLSASWNFLEIFKVGADETVTHEWSDAFSKTHSTTYMQDFRVDGGYDGVYFSYIPIDKYAYRVTSSDDPSVEPGSMLYMYNSRHDQPLKTTWRLDTFNERLYGTGVPSIDNSLLPHEPGNIGSYRHITPNFTKGELCNLFNIEEDKLIGYTAADIVPGDAGKSTVQIGFTDATGTTEGGGITTDTQVSFGCTLAKVFNIGAKAGHVYHQTWSRTDTWSASTTMGGIVPAVKSVDYQYKCRQVFYRRVIMDEQGDTLQNYLVNNWVVVGNETTDNHLIPELTIGDITPVTDGVFAVDLTLYGRKNIPSSDTMHAAAQSARLGLDHFMLEYSIDGKVWYDANTTLVNDELVKEPFDLSNEGIYDQYEATRYFEHDYIYLNNEQLQQLEDYTAGISSTPVVATYRLTLSDAIGNYKTVTQEIVLPGTTGVGLTGIDSLPVLRAKADGDNILVSGAEPLTIVNVCDLLGRVIKTVRADASGYAKIETAPHGVVIVTNASGKAKLNVK